MPLMSPPRTVLTDPHRRARLGYRLAAILIGVLAIGVLVAFPIALYAMVSEVIDPTASRAWEISTPQRPEVEGTLRVVLDTVAIEEVQRTIRFRVTAQITCPEDPCPWFDEIIFASNEEDSYLETTLPPFERLKITPEAPLSTTISLPVFGDPVQYPFDTYHMNLGFLMQRTFADGRQEVYTPAESTGRVVVTVEDAMARFRMAPPVVLAPEEVPVYYPSLNYSDVAELSFSRPVYTQALAVVLIALIASASVYAVFLRPLHDLLLGVGAIVLGVWGVRNILVPGQTFISVVDFALSTVILFVLGAVSVRAMVYFWRRSREEPATDADGDA